MVRKTGVTRTRARRFPPAIVRAADASKILGIRAGSAPHRFIGVWVVVVRERVFVRSWDRSAGGWFRTFLEDPDGRMQVGSREVAVRAHNRRDARLLDAIDAAYAAKYPTVASRKWVRGFRHPSRRAATIELVPR